MCYESLSQHKHYIMPIAIELDWEYCVDGFELEDCGPWIQTFTEGEDTTDVGGKFFRPVSDRFARKHYRFDNPNDALVLKFVAAETTEEIKRFLSEHGSTLQNPHVARERLEYITMDRNHCRKILAGGESGIRAFNRDIGLGSIAFRMAPRAGGKPMLTIQCDSLQAYMHTEAGLIVSGAGRLITCQHCGKFFVVGTGRNNDGFRSNKTHCSSACVVAASRARKKARESAQRT